MRCPYCLQHVTKYIRDERKGIYHCPECRTLIPRTLLEHNGQLSTTVGVVGFSGHGKTVYLTSLFSVLKQFSEFWPGYYYRCLDDFTHRIIYEQVPIFERGGLPDSTPANFPNPAMVQYRSLPLFGDAFVGYYDTAGEVFNDTRQIARAGTFVAHSDVALFIVSISDCSTDDLDDEMSRLLDTYVRAAEDRLDADLRKNQRLVVIFTKADLIGDRLTPELKRWLDNGGDTWYIAEMNDKLTMLGLTSFNIEQWLREEMGCHRFANMARDRFREVRYTMVSALGTDNDSSEKSPIPLRVLDPFIWILQYGMETEEAKAPSGLWERIRLWISGSKKKAPLLLNSTTKS